MDSCISDFHSAQEHGHRHGGHGYVLLAGDEDELLAAERADGGQNFQRACLPKGIRCSLPAFIRSPGSSRCLWQGHPFPLGTDNLSSPRCTEDQEFKRVACHAGLCLEFRQELWQFFIGREAW